MDAVETERGIAAARLCVATGSLILDWSTSVDPFFNSTAAATIVPAYFVFAVLAYIGFQRIGRAIPVVSLVTHLVDFGVSAALAGWALRPGPLLMLLTFLPLASAARWGARHGLVTAFGALVLLGVGTGLMPMAAKPPVGALETALDATAFAVRAAVFLSLGVLGGYLIEVQKRRRAEERCIADILTDSRHDQTFEEVLGSAIESCRRAFGGRDVLLVLRDGHSGRVFVWQTGAGRRTRGRRSAVREVPHERRGDYIFEIPGKACHLTAVRFGYRGRFHGPALRKDGSRRLATLTDVPMGFLRSHPCKRLLIGDVGYGRDGTARLFVFDPAVVITESHLTEGLSRVMDQVAPALHDRYLIRQLRMRAGAAERGRIVRELHDGPMQALSAIQLDLAVLGRQATVVAPDFAPEIARFQETLHTEVTGLREDMEGIRAGQQRSGPIQHELAQMLTRFGAQRQIETAFEHEGSDVSLRPLARRELLRIAHEALVNVRRHSHASRVVMRLSADLRDLVLTVEDNGQGLTFEGTRRGNELADGSGPRTILERADTIGGELSVWSRPGEGMRLAVRVPLRAVAEQVL
jgi:signal transduction histidine kinase